MSVYSLFHLCHGHYVTGKFERQEFWHGLYIHFYIMSRSTLVVQFERKDFLASTSIFIFTKIWKKSSSGRWLYIQGSLHWSTIYKTMSRVKVQLNDFYINVTGKVQLEALTSTRRHWSAIWKKRLLACLYIHFYIMSRAKFSWKRL